MQVPASQATLSLPASTLTQKRGVATQTFSVVRVRVWPPIQFGTGYQQVFQILRSFHSVSV